MTKVKICGITSVEDAMLAVEAGADYLGLVLAKSPRQVKNNMVARISEEVAERVPIVGVFAEFEEMRRFLTSDGTELDYYQVYFKVPQAIMRPPKIGWIRSFMIEPDTEELPFVHQDHILLDFKQVNTRRMNDLLKQDTELVQEKTFLAGGLDKSNVGRIVRKHRPFAVDVARGTEREPGHKDPELVHQFIERVRNA